MDRKRKLEILERKKQERMNQFKLTGNNGVDTVNFLELEADLFLIESEIEKLR